MIARICQFFGLQLLGAVAGYLLFFQQPLMGALAGVIASSSIWFCFDSLLGVRVLRWLRRGKADGQPVELGVWGEISDRVSRLLRQRERVGIDSEARLNDFVAALQASPNGVVLLDAQGRIEWANQTAANHFGLDARRDLQQYLGNLLRDPAFVAYWAARDFSHELAVSSPASTNSHPLQLSLQMHPYGEGRLLMLSRDVTTLKRAEVMRRDFVANVSHEIRTPLTVLSGFVETLQTLPLRQSERDSYLAMMSVQARRMQVLVSDLLTLSNLEGSPPPDFAEHISAAELMVQLEQEGRQLLHSQSDVPELTQSLSFECLLQGQLLGATSEIFSAASNLVSNAIRYTPVGGSIKVWLRGLPDGGAEFSVEDTGPGISAEHIPRLTERFYRVDRSRSRDSGGTGLGLAIVKHVCQRHGAELSIASKTGEGSRFAIVFPADRVQRNS